jgi:hypothetical protein
MMDSRFNGMESPLLGSRAVLLFHDEIIAEHPESVASDAAWRVSEIMVEALRWQCPDMYDAVKAEPTLMRALYKGASPVYATGTTDTLIPWEPS